MRKLLLGAAAISLSGCSFLGMGNGHSQYAYNPAPAYGSGYGGYGSTNAGCAPIHAVLADGNCLSRLNFEGGIGISGNVGGGDVITGDQATLGGAAIRNVDFKEAYKPGLRAEAGMSYALDPVTKITAMAFADEADGDGVVNFGTIGGQALTGQLSDYESKGIEVGVRRYFRPSPAPLVRSVRPYIEGRVGASYQDAIVIQNASLGGAAVAGGQVGLYDSGWVPAAAGLVGIETPVSPRATVGIETGIRYTGKQDSTDLTGTAFNGINDGSDRWSMPLMLRTRYRF
ncbi:MAG: hypothetical protein AAF311_12840 [Pseudomonadota bacterium]